jgi:hypothetical protein
MAKINFDDTVRILDYESKYGSVTNLKIYA